MKGELDMKQQQRGGKYVLVDKSEGLLGENEREAEKKRER